ncbi:MAG: hypothetical protein IPH33_04350 [Bacteroidetes bacterium]|nr:hypothetical protein [Bacteroidota bacterium]
MIRYSNCFLEDSISSTNCAQWNFPQTSYLNLESVAHQFVIDTVSWNVSSGISISNGCISLGTNEMIKEDYKIYPNPSTGKVYFQYLGSTENLVFNLMTSIPGWSIMVKTSHVTRNCLMPIIFTQEYILQFHRWR